MKVDTIHACIGKKLKNVWSVYISRFCWAGWFSLSLCFHLLLTSTNLQLKMEDGKPKTSLCRCQAQSAQLLSGKDLACCTIRQMLMMGVIHSLTFWNPSSPFQLSHHRSPAQENFHSVKGKAFPNFCVAFHLLRKDFGLNCQLMSPLGTWCLMWNECVVPF